MSSSSAAAAAVLMLVLTLPGPEARTDSHTTYTHILYTNHKQQADPISKPQIMIATF